MENLEKKIFEAASTGNVDLLKTLLKQDPLILDRVSLNNLSETPLHVAAILGHADFAKEILKIKPHLACEVNSEHSTPLHLASGKGHVDIVRALLSVDSDLCKARDKNGLTPLHLAAIKGCVEVLKVMVEEKPDAARLRAYGGETILHLCVRYYQLEALKVLVRAVDGPELVNAKDDEGNTVLHLAVADKQVETINFLTTIPGLDANATNLGQMTPADILIRTKRDPRDYEIEKFFKNDLDPLSQPITSSHPNRAPRRDAPHDKWFQEMKNSLMVVAILIATIAFQVIVNPPSGVWQQDNNIPQLQSLAPNEDPEVAGESIFARNFDVVYELFAIINTIGFISSLSIILLLVSGLAIRRKFFMWILIVMMWIAITAVTLVYMCALFAVTPGRQWLSSGANVAYWCMIVWTGIIVLVLISHVIRLIVKAGRKIFGALRRPRRRTMEVVGLPGASHDHNV